MPVSWHVARWGDDPFSRGSWSYIRTGGSPADRWTLAEPIDDRFVLCGEAVGTDQPSMAHGALDSGMRAGRWAATVASPGERIAVIGAGFAGVGAAAELARAGVEHLVLEARPRVGGRVHTVELLDAHGVSPVAVDAGAAWLQQFPKNPLAALATELGAMLVPTDFHNPLDAARGDGHHERGAVAAAFQALTLAARRATEDHDCSMLDVIDALDAPNDVALLNAIEGDVILETGGPLAETSARWFIGEDGVGNDDHWIVGGYQRLLTHLAEDAHIRLGAHVVHIAWTPGGLAITLTDGETVNADRCICSVPISLLQRGDVGLDPGLSARQRIALSRIGFGVVEKVILRFDERWWPAPPAGYMRWYDTPASWCEWVDLTDGCGAPVVAGLIGGEAVDRYHRGRSDADVARRATSALEDWAAAVRRLAG